jgi:hypothetical protein
MVRAGDGGAGHADVHRRTERLGIHARVHGALAMAGPSRPRSRGPAQHCGRPGNAWHEHVDWRSRAYLRASDGRI